MRYLFLIVGLLFSLSLSSQRINPYMEFQKCYDENDDPMEDCWHVTDSTGAFRRLTNAEAQSRINTDEQTLLFVNDSIYISNGNGIDLSTLGAAEVDPIFVAHLAFDITASDTTRWGTHYLSSDFDTDFALKSTTDLTEGLNLYFTEARVNANTNVAANTADRHNHLNKAVLDLITAHYTLADSTKLDGIESLATADQTDAEIKTAYENNANTNAFTDTEKTNLSNQSGTNTGDQTSIVGLTGTKAEFNTELSDGTFLYVGDVTTNQPTELSEGARTSTTYEIDSDGSMPDLTLVEADTDNAGLLGADKFDEIVANTTHSGTVTGNPHSVTKSEVGLGNVENTALSTFAGSSNITTLGTIGVGEWNGDPLETTYRKGGFHEVSDNTARDAMPPNLRVEGMFVYVESNTELWTLDGGITNSDWKKLVISGPDVLNVPFDGDRAITRIPELGDNFESTTIEGWLEYWYLQIPELSIALTPPTVYYEIGTSNDITVTATTTNIVAPLVVHDGIIRVENYNEGQFRTFGASGTGNRAFTYIPKQTPTDTLEQPFLQFVAVEDWTSGGLTGSLMTGLNDATINGVYPILYGTSANNYWDSDASDFYGSTDGTTDATNLLDDFSSGNEFSIQIESDDEFVYFFLPRSIELESINDNDGNGNELIQNYSDVDELLPIFKALVLDETNNTMYFSGLNISPFESTIYKSTDGGKDIEEILSIQGLNIGAITIDEVNSKLYYTQGTVIFRCDLDGTNIETWHNSDDTYKNVQVDGEKVYWIADHNDGGTFYVKSANIDKSSETQLITISDATYRGLCVGDSYAFYMDGAVIYRIDSDDGANKTMMYVDGAIQAHYLAINTVVDSIYYHDAISDKLYRQPYSGVNDFQLGTETFTSFRGIDVKNESEGEIYIIDYDAHKILKASASGTGYTTLIDEYEGIVMASSGLPFDWGPIDYRMYKSKDLVGTGGVVTWKIKIK